MRLLLTFVILSFACCGYAQNWQSQMGTNLATLPGKSIEITSEFSPNLNAWALTLQGGYTFQNSFGGFASGYMCDCGVDDIKTSGAFLKAGARIDVIRSSKPTAKVGLKLGSAFVGSSYDQKGIINSFSSGEKTYYPTSEHGIRIGLALSAAAAFRLSSRWGLDVGLQKFVPFSSRDNYLISGNFMSHQPGVGLLSQEATWYTGLQGIITIHYQLN
ncbi:hypothetical protein [Siphonobacter sp. SORGH_AS_1065]|uniref:hypothetical protein n=1 Tax=Siphonobacter sp. SORGH_AS_1065 TaxID=3041795 RepID=UPI0027843B0A|nr:hypothetical protein [Siphonobacter sp. SORGH_AS_1065]MDQ1085499.1 hypothetical protein [Siphonobacter sp. SORGH_AS_1065]